MMDVNNKFDGTFSTHCQEESVPMQLISLVSMLIDGSGISKDVSQHALTCAQLIMYNFRTTKKTSQGNQLPAV